MISRKHKVIKNMIAAIITIVGPVAKLRKNDNNKPKIPENIAISIENK